VLCGLWAVTALGAGVEYQNPVIAGDFPDPSVIHVGKDFWATATSSEWGPQFPLLHSVDLVNWELTGPVFAHRPDWAVGNFWAPEISQHEGRYFVYYVGRKKGGPLAVAVASAEKPSGPYTDHGPLVAQAAGSIDPVAVTDEKDQRYLIWKEDGNSRKQPTILWAQPLAQDGCNLIGEPKEIMRNDAPWEGAVIEGPFVVHSGEWFYLFYSGSGCCGSDCNYALGVARSRSLLGPWEKNPANPILAGNSFWKCPGHGSIVQDEQSRYWLLYHAYSTKDFIFTGREALLDEVKFGPDGWPTINDRKGPSATSSSPYGLAQHRSVNFEDEFTGPALRAGWQWPQNNEPVYRIDSGQKGTLVLSPKPEVAKDLIGAILARSTTTGDYTALTEIDRTDLKSDAFAGIAAIGDTENAMGLAASDTRLLLWHRDKGQFQKLAEAPVPITPHLHLRLIAAQGHLFHFAASADGKTWTPMGDTQKGDKLPPWDRSIRVGLTVGGAENAVGRFVSFRMTP
jgi:beta-xylosidase